LSSEKSNRQAKTGNGSAPAPTLGPVCGDVQHSRHIHTFRARTSHIECYDLVRIVICYIQFLDSDVGARETGAES